MPGNYQVDIWAILGETGTGKSTTIKTLTSREHGPPHPKTILLRGGGHLQVFSKVMAWQENNKSPSDAVAEIHDYARRQEAARPPISISHINILMALRFEPHLGHPAGCEYLSHFVDAGMNIKSIVLMSPGDSGAYDHYGRFGAPTLWHFRSRDQDLGEMVGYVRNHFRWA